MGSDSHSDEMYWQVIDPIEDPIKDDDALSEEREVSILGNRTNEIVTSS
jgi:hypothetical protein